MRAALVFFLLCVAARHAAASDAGPCDAGPSDAGPSDAGPSDAGPPDAGPFDAGPVGVAPPEVAPPAAAPVEVAPPEVARPRAPPALRVSGYVQLDGVLRAEDSLDELDPATGEPLNQERYLVRRARLRGDLVEGDFAGSLELDGNTMAGPAARLVFAEATWSAVPALAVTLGVLKIPFGAEVPSPTDTRLFLEPTTASRALFPGEYDAGVRVRGAWGFLRYALALVNGSPTGARPFPGRDPDADKDLVGRVGLDTPVTGRVSVRAGLSLLSGTGFHAGTPASKDTVVWRDVNEDGRVQVTELQVIEGAPATPSAGFDRYALGGDLAVEIELPWLGRLVVSGELVWAENLDRSVEPADPVASGRDLRELGWQLGLTSELGEHALLGVRYDRYRPDADARDQQGAMLVPLDPSYATLAVALAWRFSSRARLIVEYDLQENKLGRDTSGAPTRLASDRLTLRAQVSF